MWPMHHLHTLWNTHCTCTPLGHSVFHTWRQGEGHTQALLSGFLSLFFCSGDSPLLLSLSPHSIISLHTAAWHCGRSMHLWPSMALAGTWLGSPASPFPHLPACQTVFVPHLPPCLPASLPSSCSASTPAPFPCLLGRLACHHAALLWLAGWGGGGEPLKTKRHCT